MSYSSLKPTQFISNANLQDAVNTSAITLKVGQVIPSNNREVTKLQASTYANISPFNTYISPKLRNQYIAKRDITPYISVAFNYSFNRANGQFFILDTTTSTLVVNLTTSGSGSFTFINGHNYSIQVQGDVTTTSTYLYVHDDTTNTTLHDLSVNYPDSNTYVFIPTTDTYTIVASTT